MWTLSCLQLLRSVEYEEDSLSLLEVILEGFTECFTVLDEISLAMLKSLLAMGPRDVVVNFRNCIQQFLDRARYFSAFNISRDTLSPEGIQLLGIVCSAHMWSTQKDLSKAFHRVIVIL